MRGMSSCLQPRETVPVPAFENLHFIYQNMLCDTSDSINSGDLKDLLSLSKIDELSDKLVTVFISKATDRTTILLYKLACPNSITVVTLANDKATKIDKRALGISKLFTIILQDVTDKSYMILIVRITARI